MYVAVKGGEEAIANAHRLLAEDRRGDPAVPELTLEQITGQLTLAVDRVMSEGSCYDPRAGRAGDQAGARRSARGDLPAPRVSHDAAPARAVAARSTRRR